MRLSVSQSVKALIDPPAANTDARREPPHLETAIAQISKRLDNTDAASFLEEFALSVCKALGADYFVIGRLNPFSNIMRTLKFVVDGALTDNMIYSLDGTPCEITINDGVCIHRDNVADDYPRDQDLKVLNVHSYAGVALETSDGETLGVIVAMWRSKLQHVAFVTGLLEYYRRRVGSIVETTEKLNSYSWALSNVFSGVWDWDLRTGGTTVSKELQQIIGAAGGRGGSYDLTQIENAMHPDDRPKHVEALKRHINEGSPYDLRLRLRDQTGLYRWYVSRGRVTRDAAGKPERMIGGFCDINDIVVTLTRTAKD